MWLAASAKGMVDKQEVASVKSSEPTNPMELASKPNKKRRREAKDELKEAEEPDNLSKAMDGHMQDFGHAADAELHTNDAVGDSTQLQSHL